MFRKSFTAGLIVLTLSTQVFPEVHAESSPKVSAKKATKEEKHVREIRNAAEKLKSAFVVVNSRDPNFKGKVEGRLETVNEGGIRVKDVHRLYGMDYIDIAYRDIDGIKLGASKSSAVRSRERTEKVEKVFRIAGQAVDWGREFGTDTNFAANYFDLTNNRHREIGVCPEFPSTGS